MRVGFDHRSPCQPGRSALDITYIYSTRQAIRDTIDGRCGLASGASMSAGLDLDPVCEDTTGRSQTCWHISKPVHSRC